MKFAYEQEGGTVAIAIPVSKKSLERQMGPMTDEEYRAFMISRLIPESVKDFIELPDDCQEPDRAKRADWRIRDGQVVIG